MLRVISTKLIGSIGPLEGERLGQKTDVGSFVQQWMERCVLRPCLNAWVLYRASIFKVHDIDLSGSSASHSQGSGFRSSSRTSAANSAS